MRMKEAAKRVLKEISIWFAVVLVSAAWGLAYFVASSLSK